jgi:hypothetical protein
MPSKLTPTTTVVRAIPRGDVQTIACAETRPGGEARQPFFTLSQTYAPFKCTHLRRVLYTFRWDRAIVPVHS